MQDSNSRASTPDSIAAIVRRPLRAEIYQKELTAIRQAIILAMLEIGDSTGQHLKISIPRIAAWAKLDRKTVQRALWGDHRKHPDRPRPKREKGRDKECPFCRDSLITSRILQPVTSADWKKHRPAEYRLNPELLDDFPEVRHYLDQRKLNFSPDSLRPTVAPPRDPRSLPLRPTVASPSDPRSHDSKAFDSRSTDSKASHSGASPREKTARGEARSRESFPPCRPHDPDFRTEAKAIAKTLAEQIDIVATPANIGSLVAALDHVSKKHDLTTQEASEYLKMRVRNARESGEISVYSPKAPRFFFEDGRYEDSRFAPAPEGGYHYSWAADRKCPLHPGSGLTNWGTCWACYSEKYSDERPQRTDVSEPKTGTHEK